MNLHRLIASALLLGSMCAQPHAARAAQSLDTCAGFIDALPATISTQGVWCLRHDLSTNIASGNAITIAANNVTIDCNDFKIGGLAAGNASVARGINANTRQNVTIRRCNIRGFLVGIDIEGGAGHLVEDNRLDNNLASGIYVYTYPDLNNLIQRNRVYDTGGSAGNTESFGIRATADAVDNTVYGVFADKSGGYLFGIYLIGDGTDARGNKVSGFVSTATQGGSITGADGIYGNNWYHRISGNQIAGPGGTGTGIGANGDFYCLDNTVHGFAINIATNGACSGNLTL
jgi:parallel beta-helix repeat protein